MSSTIVGQIVLYRPADKKLLGTEEVLPALVLQRSPEDQETVRPLVDLAVFGPHGGLSVVKAVPFFLGDPGDPAEIPGWPAGYPNICWPR